MKKVLLISNSSWYLYNFRKTLAKRARAAGWEPILVAPKDSYTRLLRDEGFKFIELSMDRSSLSLSKELGVFYSLYRIFKEQKPDLVHHFTIKCVIYGTLAARMAGVKKIVNSITGLGHVFLNQTAKMRFIRPFVVFAYRICLFSKKVHVIFQNQQDQDEFKQRKLVDLNRCSIIPTSGVDVERFKPKKDLVRSTTLPIVLFASRLLYEKGIVEFIEAIRILRSRNCRAIFKVAGSSDEGNPSSIQNSMLLEWCKELSIEALGHVEDMVELLSNTDIFVLPSYREGGPKSVLEASAMEVAVIASDVPGCNTVVERGKTGLLVPVKNTSALADAIEALVQNKTMRESLGREGRKKIMNEFTDVKIADSTVKVYLDLR